MHLVDEDIKLDKLFSDLEGVEEIVEEEDYIKISFIGEDGKQFVKIVKDSKKRFHLVYKGIIINVSMQLNLILFIAKTLIKNVSVF